MIRDLLIPKLKQSFPDQAFVFNKPPKPDVSLKSPCQALGEMDISDDGDEITIYFTLTHGHFNCDEESLTVEQREQKIVDDVIAFLEALFKDRVVIWGLPGYVAGGWRVLQAGETAP